MEHNVTFWPMLVIIITLAFLLVIIFIRSKKPYQVPVTREIWLSPCYSLNKMNTLLVKGLLLEKENVLYEDYFFWLRFSPEGDIFVRREWLGHICWERFGQNGESLGLVKKSEIQRMEISGEILRANYIAKQGDRIAAVVVDFKDYDYE